MSARFPEDHPLPGNETELRRTVERRTKLKIPRCLGEKMTNDSGMLNANGLLCIYGRPVNRVRVLRAFLARYCIDISAIWRKFPLSSARRSHLAVSRRTIKRAALSANLARLTHNSTRSFMHLIESPRRWKFIYKEYSVERSFYTIKYY